jgi:error-prone DNA polymerase
MSSGYIELQTLSNFSFLRGASHPDELVKHAAALGYPAVGICDRHSLAGVVRAHVAAKKHGIKLITGTSLQLFRTIPSAQRPQEEGEYLEAFLERSSKNMLPLSLLLYPTSKKAYGVLCRLLTLGKRRAPKGQCYITLEDLKQANQGLLAIAIVHDFKDPYILQHLKKLKDIFDADRISLRITNSYGPEHTRRIYLIEQLHQLTQIPLVVTNDVHYHSAKRRKLQDILTCIRYGKTLETAGFILQQNAERYLKDAKEMRRLFRRYPLALRRSVEIASLAQLFSLDQLSYEYPEEICPKDKTPFQYLTELTKNGCREYYPAGVPEKVKKQIRYELSLIKELQYEKYFLTVYDIALFARRQKILHQGRGAAANSAVCYVLGITAVDPNKINLLFERFISRERNEPPDIDIDFEHERREEVIQHIYSKYGRERAALTATVVTYRIRSAVREVAKVFGLDEETIISCQKIFTRSDSNTFTKEDLLNRKLDPTNKAVVRTLIFAQQLRGFPRHLSQHVGGFIISQEALCEIVPIENASMANRTVIEWDKDDIEQLGMLKIDILALGMLSVIRKSFDSINKQRKLSQGESYTPIALHNVPQEDAAVYDMLCKADTIGVFQIESRAQMSMLPRLRPRCYYDLVIEVAIVRPGPIQGGMVHPYLRRRNGEEKIWYPNKAIEKILSSTLGVPIFQEQVMELAVVAAGFTPGEADELRRAIASWKKSEKQLPRFKKRLINGMLKRGYQLSFAERVFEQIQGFGEYGFPQSHAASFALLVYVSSWLKRHHPATFAAALLNSQPMGFYRPAQIVEDAKRHGVEVREVDVARSQWNCTLETKNGEINKDVNGRLPALVLRLGMRSIRGMRKDAAEEIIKAIRRHKEFLNLNDLWRKSNVSSSVLKKLAHADAYRSIGMNRQQALWEIKRLRDDPLPLFEGLPCFDGMQVEDSSFLPEFSAISHVMQDYQTIGLSLKAHPMSFIRETLEKRNLESRHLKKKDIYRCNQVASDVSLKNGCRLGVAGMVLVRQRPKTSSGVVFVTLEDESGIANLIVKSPIFNQYRDVVCDSIFLLAFGLIQREKEVVHIICDGFEDLTPSFSGLDSRSRDFH